MGQVVVVGLDIAKSVFQVHGVDREGKMVVHLVELVINHAGGTRAGLAGVYDRSEGLADDAGAGPLGRAGATRGRRAGPPRENRQSA
jgi:hypothetical protein